MLTWSKFYKIPLYPKPTFFAVHPTKSVENDVSSLAAAAMSEFVFVATSLYRYWLLLRRQYELAVIPHLTLQPATNRACWRSCSKHWIFPLHPSNNDSNLLAEGHVSSYKTFTASFIECKNSIVIIIPINNNHEYRCKCLRHHHWPYTVSCSSINYGEIESCSRSIIFRCD